MNTGLYYGFQAGSAVSLAASLVQLSLGKGLLLQGTT